MIRSHLARRRQGATGQTFWEVIGIRGRYTRRALRFNPQSPKNLTCRT